MATAQNNPGFAFVVRYMVPLLRSHFGQRAEGKLVCLHLAAPDDDESAALRQHGHQSISVPVEPWPSSTVQWSSETVIAAGGSLPFARESFDFIFTNAFGVFARAQTERRDYARQLRHLVRPGGALLLSMGNRRCPVDLSHAPGSKASLRDLEEAFSDSWSHVSRLNADGYFGFSRIPKLARPWLSLVKPYLRWASAPHRRWLYASPLNSVLILWVAR
jgi:SAM-dependent methyltransferase